MHPTASQLLDHLRRMRHLSFDARSESATGWNGQGSGGVAVESPSTEVVLFRESGTWRPEGQPNSVAFRNVYQWTLVDANTVRLAHLRLGPDRPVFLLDLVPASGEAWLAAEPHLCVNDRYALRLETEPAGLRAIWTIQGPKKRETLAYTYTA